MENIEKIRTTPKDFFIHLGVLISLYISVSSILTLIFCIIDQVYPKEFGYTDPYAGGVSLAMAMLIVSFPLCILFSRALSKEEVLFPEKRNLWVRKVLTYATLFISLVVVAVDIIVLLNSFFGGEEITTSFALKVFFIIVVIGAVASYYLYDLRRPLEDDGKKVSRRYAYGASVLVLLAFSFGFFEMGSPYTQKQKRFDAERVMKLQSIQYQIISYWQAKQKIPNVLSDINDPLSGFIVPVDPVNKEQYEYVSKDKLSFQLCATFSIETPRGAGWNQTPGPIYSYPYKNGVDENWQHGAGRTCFDRTIDPEKYSLQKGMPMAVPAPVFMQ